MEPSGSDSYQALNYGEVKGMWISYLDIMEMSSGTESAFRSEIAAAYDNCAALGINTVYVHRRNNTTNICTIQLSDDTKKPVRRNAPDRFFPGSGKYRNYQ